MSYLQVCQESIGPDPTNLQNEVTISIRSGTEGLGLTYEAG